MVVDRLDHHPASGHERLEWDDTSGFSLALSQHLVDLPYGLEPSKGIEHVLVLAAVLVQASDNLTKSPFQGADTVIGPGTLPLRPKKFFNLLQALSNPSSIWRVKVFVRSWRF